MNPSLAIPAPALGLPVTVTIPTIGSKITLTEPWTFHLHDEHRNRELWKTLLPKIQCRGWDETGNHLHGDAAPHPLTLLPGTLLSVDRIFIRKNARDYDSVSFYILESPNFQTQKTQKRGKYLGRFWVKLSNANKIIGIWDQTTLPN